MRDKNILNIGMKYARDVGRFQLSFTGRNDVFKNTFIFFHYKYRSHPSTIKTVEHVIFSFNYIQFKFYAIFVVVFSSVLFHLLVHSAGKFKIYLAHLFIVPNSLGVSDLTHTEVYPGNAAKLRFLSNKYLFCFVNLWA